MAITDDKAVEPETVGRYSQSTEVAETQRSCLFQIQKVQSD